MLMTFEKFMNEDYEFARMFDSSAAYPSIFELICLLPLSKKTELLDASYFSDDSLF